MNKNEICDLIIELSPNSKDIIESLYNRILVENLDAEHVLNKYKAYISQQKHKYYGKEQRYIPKDFKIIDFYTFLTRKGWEMNYPISDPILTYLIDGSDIESYTEFVKQTNEEIEQKSYEYRQRREYALRNTTEPPSVDQESNDKPE